MRAYATAACLAAVIFVAPALAGESHVVRPGDTLTSVAARTGASVAALGRANGISRDAVLPVGRALEIPAAAQPVRADRPMMPDPCLRRGRDICGTLGVGAYRRYRYGLRWFGDYRQAAPARGSTFCIDLGYWYPSRDARYRDAPATGLRNRHGDSISAEARARMAYALWRYGRSSDVGQQAAVMLFVHSLMRDARPGEVDARVLGPRVSALYRRVARDARRYAGPYRVEATLAPGVTVGARSNAAIRVVSASGRGVPGVALSLAAPPGWAVSTAARTDRAGSATIAVLPSAAGPARVRVTARGLAAPEPRLFVATAARARPNAQRLVAPSSRAVAATVDVVVAKRPLGVAVTVENERALVGEANTVRVAVSALPSWRGKASVRAYGPFPERTEVTCAGTPATRVSVPARAGASATAALEVARAGWYALRASAPGDRDHVTATTACAGSGAVLLAEASPRVDVGLSHDVVLPRSPVELRVASHGLGATGATAVLEAFGPFAARAAIRCVGVTAQERRLLVRGDGARRAGTVRFRRPGLYAVRVRLLPSRHVAAARSTCGETRSVLVRPQIWTGRGDPPASDGTAVVAPAAPVRVQAPRVGLDGPVAPVAIDVRSGLLALPRDVDRAAWWQDGQAPGAASGAILIAGHVDTAEGAAAFFALRRLRRADVVVVTTADGRDRAYRVDSARRYEKRSLPASVYSQRGPARLVLVTCGGPFDRRTERYRDNLVVTARPLAVG